MASEIEMRRPRFQTQTSSLEGRQRQAICVRHAYKKYGSKKNPCIILDDLNMTVPKGAIYGLLGASGCGKTTLLNCIVGRKRLNAGDIWVLGGRPGSRGSGVPGPRIGYMPQELALYGEFTIRETLKYFGWITNMTPKQIEEQLAFLTHMLMLPDVDRLVKNLSGGQQRRVSLSAALVHSPELLILDEPTVGVDPLLRQNIWNHLVEITKNGSTTVIITTHYIDETRQAHLIGLMRGGYFLAEETPDRLIAQFAAQSLEEVFLKLSVLQNMGKRRQNSILHEVNSDASTIAVGAVNEGAVLDDEVPEITGEFGDNVSLSSRGHRVLIAPEVTIKPIPPDEPMEEAQRPSCIDYCKIVSFNHMRALIWKNSLWMWRNIPIMLFIMGLPVVQTVIFCISIGHNPFGLGVSVVNHELEPNETCEYAPGCNSTRLSCNFLHFMDPKVLIFNNRDTDEAGKDVVRAGKAWITMIIPHNFSDAIRARVSAGQDVTPYDLDASTVKIYQDKSNENIATFIQRDLIYGFVDFFQDFMKTCGIDPRVGMLPINFKTPVYGSTEPDFTNFAAPGIAISIIFFLAVALTSGALLFERNAGILERSLVNGITGVEVIFSHVVTQFTVMFGQSLMVLIFTFAVFRIEQNGNIFWVSLMVIMNGLCGMCFGFIIACICDTERSATYLAMGSFLPIILLCGVIWPIESMHYILRYISSALPLTKSTESLRSMIARGWPITEPVVYEGFIAMTGWIVIFLIISILLLKFRKG